MRSHKVNAKCDKRSVELRKEGNKKFNNLEFFSALEFYNKALCFAVSKENLALAYANRSAVYVEVERYEECLQNIHWAQANGYPLQKIDKLKNRADVCFDMMNDDYKRKKNQLEDFFKLSYPQNPKLPFMADCLEQKENNSKKGVFASRDLKPGEIIAIEEPFAFGLFIYHMSCFTCMRMEMLNLLPISEDASHMFCLKCGLCPMPYTLSNISIPPLIFPALQYTTLTYDQVRCQIIDEEIKEEDVVYCEEGSAEENKKTVFDFDLSNSKSVDYKKNLLQCWLGLKHKLDPNSKEKSKFAFDNAQHLHVDEISVRGHGFSSFGIVLYLFLNTINHACYSNVMNVIVNHQSVLYVTRPIKAGEEILFNFASPDCLFGDRLLNILPYEQRKVLLWNNRHLKCKCFFCKFDLTDEKLKSTQLPFENNMKHLINNAINMCYSLETSEIMISILKHNWKILEPGDHPDLLIFALLKKRNDQMMKYLANLLTNPCINLIRGPMNTEIVNNYYKLGHELRDNERGIVYMKCKACEDEGQCQAHCDED